MVVNNPLLSLAPPALSYQVSEKHSNLAIELVDSEITYVDYLRTMSDAFYARLKAMAALDKPVLSANQIKVLFMNFEGIYAMSQQLREDLLKLRYNGEQAVVEGVGKVMKKYIPFMRLYTEYVGNYPQSMKLLESLDKDKKWKEFQLLSEMCGKQKLPSLLIMPVQRVPRYVMILKELYKSATGKSKEDIKEVYDELEKTAQHINSQARNMASRKKVVDYQEELFANSCRLVTPTRCFIHEGDLIKVHNKGANIMRRTEHYLFILFNDVLMYASRSSTRHAKFKHALPLDTITIQDDGDSSTNQLKHNEIGFYIKISEHSTAKSFLVLCSNKETRDEWTKQIRAASKKHLDDIHTLNREPKTVEQIESEIHDADRRPSASPLHTRMKTPVLSPAVGGGGAASLMVLDDAARRGSMSVTGPPSYPASSRARNRSSSIASDSQEPPTSRALDFNASRPASDSQQRPATTPRTGTGGGAAPQLTRGSGARSLETSLMPPPLLPPGARFPRATSEASTLPPAAARQRGTTSASEMKSATMNNNNTRAAAKSSPPASVRKPSRSVPKPPPRRPSRGPLMGKAALLPPDKTPSSLDKTPSSQIKAPPLQDKTPPSQDKTTPSLDKAPSSQKHQAPSSQDKTPPSLHDASETTSTKRNSLSRWKDKIEQDAANSSPLFPKPGGGSTSSHKSVSMPTASSVDKDTGGSAALASKAKADSGAVSSSAQPADSKKKTESKRRTERQPPLVPTHLKTSSMSVPKWTLPKRPVSAPGQLTKRANATSNQASPRNSPPRVSSSSSTHRSSSSMSHAALARAASIMNDCSPNASTWPKPTSSTASPWSKQPTSTASSSAAVRSSKASLPTNAGESVAVANGDGRRSAERSGQAAKPTSVLAKSAARVKNGYGAPSTEHLSNEEKLLSFHPGKVFALTLLLGLASTYFGVQLSTVATVIGVVYPLFMSYKAVRTDDTADDQQWLVYWIVFAALSLFDALTSYVLDHIPFYYVIKLLFLVYLMCPPDQAGARWLHAVFIKRTLDGDELTLGKSLHNVGGAAARGYHALSRTLTGNHSKE